MDNVNKAEFDVLRNMIYVVTFVSLCFLTYSEYAKAKDSHIQSMLEAEYAYDYACSQSSQIIKEAEYSRNVFVSNALYVNCGGLEQGEMDDKGNFIRPLDVEKSYSKPNGGLTVLPTTI